MTQSGDFTSLGRLFAFLRPDECNGDFAPTILKSAAPSVLIASGAGTKLTDKGSPMTLPWDLENWLTDVGGQVVEKEAALGDDSLSKQEHLILAIWLLDTEARNGGLSQYFANHGVEQWKECVTLASPDVIPSFTPFAEAVTVMLSGNPDPYLALIARDAEASDLYRSYQPSIVSELRQSVVAGF